MKGRHTNLLQPLGTFVGRTNDLDAIRLHQARGARLVTLVGPPGIGKTRLAMRYAEVAGGPCLLAGGVWFCDLTEARRASDACATLARSLGLNPGADLDRDRVAEHVESALAD
ncbi:MAG TPA: AAA family ATPase, partial [Labilithrix sp.]|nr:AAA family ATPase [Labilithrix sp.]